MAVILDFYTVLIRNETIEHKYPGGVDAYASGCPNRTYCTDGALCRVGFMSSRDAFAFVDSLVALGFVPPTEEDSEEIAVVDEQEGFVRSGDWLKLSRVDIGGPTLTLVARVQGEALDRVVGPPGWKPTASGVRLSPEEAAKLEFVGTSDGMDMYRDRATGEILYTARARPGSAPAHVPSGAHGERFEALVQELERFGAFDGSKENPLHGELETCHARAKQLVVDTQGLEPGPLQLQGIAARHLRRWDEAAELFRRVTELRPEYVDAWLELTWALDSLGQLEAAESAARSAVQRFPQAPRAVGNLATILTRRGRHAEAHTAIEQALALDPQNKKNLAIARKIEQAAPRRTTWWSRLFPR